MMLEKLARWAVPGALLTAGAFFTAGVVVWMFPGSHEYADGVRVPGGPSMYVFEGLVALGVLGLLAALVGIYQNQALQSGRLGKVGFWIAFVGTVSIFVGTVLAIGSMALRGDYQVLDGILFDLTLLAWFVGFPLFGIATLRAKVFPAWVGIMMLGWHLLFVAVTVLVGDGAAHATVGLVWLTIGYGLWMQEQSSARVDVEDAEAQVAAGG